MGQINHFAILVQRGMLDRAVDEFFLSQLGWKEDVGARVQGDWGKARFVYRHEHPAVRLQLTESAESTEADILSGVHVAIGFLDPEKAAKRTLEWARSINMSFADIEEVPGGKWFVALPGFFRLEFEFVPLPKLLADTDPPSKKYE